MKPTSQLSQTNASSFVGSRQFKPQTSQLGSSLKKSKMEGYDVISPKDNLSSTLKKTASKSTLGKNAIDNTTTKKSSVESNIEEQYMKSLQDEVKLLEYELKLLKDKETEEQSNFTSFFKYFNDGVPINENILAMKNVYSNTRTKLSEQIQTSTHALEEVKQDNETLEHEIADLDERYHELDEIIAKKQEDYKKEYTRFENMYFNEFYYAKEQEPELKDLQKKTRYYQGEIMVFNRNKDKEALIEGRKEAMDAQALDKLKKNVKAIDEVILEKHKAVDDLMHTDVFEHERTFFEEQNEIYKKRILSTKNDVNMMTVKIAEQKYILETQAKDIANDVSQRLALAEKIFSIKEHIEEQQKMTEGLVQKKVEELERDRVRIVEQEIANIQKRQLNLIQDRSEELEKLNDEIIYNKVEQEKDLIDLQIEEEALQKKIKESKERLHQLKVDIDIGTLRERELEDIIDPLSQKVDILVKENPRREQKVADLQQQIHKAEQQLDLISQFKNFNFEEAKMAYASNNQINKSIDKLLREYHKITSSI